MTTGRELHWNIAGDEVSVRIDEAKGHGTFHAGARSIRFKLLDRSSRSVTLEVDGRRHLFFILRNREQFSVWHNGNTYLLSRVTKTPLGDSAHTALSGDITARMPGKILRIEVAVGEEVAEKQTVVIMESMKMETALQAPKAGRVAEVRVKAGQVVDMGEVLIVVE
jgi:3-methylcrotonyl-CoA carboxylase alpha subunit